MNLNRKYKIKSLPKLQTGGEKAYETHVAWPLFEAARLEPSKPYAETGLANLRWALSLQQTNGWFKKCCLNGPSKPLTHAIGYVLRGVLEGYLFTSEPSLLKACRKTADGLVSAISNDGFLPGRLDSNWRGKTKWACLTGSVQIAYCLLILYKYTALTTEHII